MDKLSVRELTEADIQQIAAWRYEEPYDLYNISAQALQEFRNGLYRALVTPNDELKGFVCWGTSAQVRGVRDRGHYDDESLLDMGLGMHPDLTGCGLGASFVNACLKWLAQTFAPAGFRLTVASFNRRAIRVYQKAGFEMTALCKTPTTKGEFEFTVMEKR